MPPKIYRSESCFAPEHDRWTTIGERYRPESDIRGVDIHLNWSRFRSFFCPIHRSRCDGLCSRQDDRIGSSSNKLLFAQYHFPRRIAEGFHSSSYRETVETPTARAVCMAVAMQQGVSEAVETWRKRGYDLGFGVGIALGYATLGQTGFEGRFHYGAIGPLLNLTSRLCDEADAGQILVTQQVFMDFEDLAEVEPVGELTLKGFLKPVPAYNVVGLKGADV